jgi:hypothetical protein
MKKLILLSLVFITTLSASSQNWIQYKKDADELKGTQASSRHFIEIPEKGVVMLDDNLALLGFVTYNGIFDYKPYKDDFNVAIGIFGMYDETGKLVDKKEIMVSVHDDPSSASADIRITVLKNSGISQVASWIRNNKGSVRIIIPRYGKSDFDVTVPTFLSQKKSGTKPRPRGITKKGGTKSPVRKK